MLMGNHEAALDAYSAALVLREKRNDSVRVAMILVNFGGTHWRLGDMAEHSNIIIAEQRGAIHAEVETGSASPNQSSSIPAPTPSLSPGTVTINEGLSQESDINFISALRGGIWQVAAGQLRLVNPAPMPSSNDNGNLAI